MSLSKLLQKNCAAEQWQQVFKFIKLLKIANKTVNLVSRKDINYIIEHHVVPSFAFKILNRIHNIETILDIGCGGGFPGIINAILYPTSKFVLVDSTKKKITFLQEIIINLQLTNVEAIWSRVEDMSGQKKYQQAFDHTTARAVAPLLDLVKWSQPLLKSNGTIEALKGGDINQEILQAKTNKNIHVQRYVFPKEWQINERLENLAVVSATLNH